MKYVVFGKKEYLVAYCHCDNCQNCHDKCGVQCVRKYTAG